MEDVIGFAIFGLLWVIPLWIICDKVGLPPVVSLAAVIPWIGILIVLGILAHVTWPRVRSLENSAMKLVILIILGIFVIVLPGWFGVKIARRAGFAPAAGLLVGIPIVGLVTLWVWAFTRWPALGEMPAEPDIGRRG